MTTEWWMVRRFTVPLRERLAILFGRPVYVRFLSPDGRCHGACSVEVKVQPTWPDEWPQPPAKLLRKAAAQ